MFMRYGPEWPKKHDLASLRCLGSVGEPINPEAWNWYYKNIGGERCPIIDTWWQTETGGFMISPSSGIGLVPLKPGSATFPMPGVEAAVVNEKGEPTHHGERGYLIIKKPWPGMLQTIWKDPERYEEVFFKKFPGYYYTGDYCAKDSDGYFWLLGRADEVLKVAGHRIGTTELESILVAHPAVAESAVVGKSDPIKGEVTVAYIVLKQGFEPKTELAEALIQHVKKEIGPIAAPANIYFVSKLPKTRSGKIMRRLIRAVVSGTLLGDVTALEDEASIEEVKHAYEELRREIE